MLNTEDTIILIVDIQEKLVNMLKEDTVTGKAAKLVKAAGILNIPVIITEQYPKGLGSTVEVIKQEKTKDTVFFEKYAFSAMQESGFVDLLNHYNREQVIVCGIEAHVCVYQTVADLLDYDYEVEVIQDMCASRTEYEYNAGFEKMKELGAGVATLEIVLFELLKTSKHPNFKEIQALIK